MHNLFVSQLSPSPNTMTMNKQQWLDGKLYGRQLRFAQLTYSRSNFRFSAKCSPNELNQMFADCLFSRQMSCECINCTYNQVPEWTVLRRRLNNASYCPILIFNQHRSFFCITEYFGWSCRLHTSRLFSFSRDTSSDGTHAQPRHTAFCAKSIALWHLLLKLQHGFYLWFRVSTCQLTQSMRKFHVIEK